jgi:hypothetical protein
VHPAISQPARELLGVAEPLLEKKLHPTLIVSTAHESLQLTHLQYYVYYVFNDMQWSVRDSLYNVNGT